MECLEKIVPPWSVNSDSPNTSYAERQMLDKYMEINYTNDSSCEDCNNCGSGDCSSCCGSTDD